MDRNFDDLVDRFERKIYGGVKGAIRLAALERDLREHVPQLWQSKPLRVLDAGGGFGQFAGMFASLGHEVTLCDLSSEMLRRAAALHEQAYPGCSMDYVHGAIQQLAQQPEHQAGYDIVLCHAVLEWVEEPMSLVAALQQLAKPDGLLSLMFYNVHSLIYRNLIRGNFRKVERLEAGDFSIDTDTLTPMNPLKPLDVREQLVKLGMQPMAESGVRVIYDYMAKPAQQARTLEDIITMELRYSQREPFRSQGRYYHILAKQGQ